MDEYKQYLAANVLNESQIVNYRLLGRALKVHSTLAKQMLFEFHRTQNAKKPHSVHATYVVSGKKKPEQTTNGVHSSHGTDGEDVSMQSSPPFSSIPKSGSDSQHEEEVVPVTTITLVKEEDIEAVRGQYEEIQSVYVYSLEAGPITDLQLLSECNRKVAKEYASEDPLTEWKKYGVIQNPNVWRRTTRGKPPPSASSSSGAGSKATSTSAKKDEATDAAKSVLSSSAKSKPSEPSKKADTKPSSTLRRDSSNISSMFANAKSKPKSSGKDTGSGSSAATPAQAGSPAEDSPMKDVEDDDEEGDDGDLAPMIVDEGKAEAARKEKRAREERLRAMMDEDDADDRDEEMPDVDAERPNVNDEMEQEAEAANVIDDSGALDARSKAKMDDGDKGDEVKVEGGRRRGRRKVMRKKTTKDEDGFLVTTEEPVWESFSEDEPEVKKAKAQPASSPLAAAKTSGAKKGGAKGQGNIMNFFKKG